MNNSSLIKVKVQDLNEDKKTIKERRLIFQKIKPFMEAYGLQPELFQLKGKSVVFKSNNSINNSQLSKSGVTSKSVIIANKARKISIKKRDQNPQRKIIAPIDYQPLTISEKYAQLFAELQQNHDNTKTPSGIQQSAIPEEADEVTDNSTMKKQVLSEIAELDQQVQFITRIKQQKLEELQNLEQKIQELQNQEHNILSNRQFVIRQPTLRQKKDKAASLIQAHIKGRIDQRRYKEWKISKELKIKKLIKIQQWWKYMLKRRLIFQKFQLTHISKQLKEIGGYTFLVFSNYSHPLKRIRMLFVQRSGVIKQDFRFYIIFENLENILQEQPQITSFEYNNLLDLITSSLLKILKVHNNKIDLNVNQKNVVYIERLTLSVKVLTTHLQNNQYQIEIEQETNEDYQVEENYDQQYYEDDNQVGDSFHNDIKQNEFVESQNEMQQSYKDTEVIQEQSLKRENKELQNSNQEKLNDEMHINNYLNENHQSQLSETKPVNQEQQIQCIPLSHNFICDEQKQESPKNDLIKKKPSVQEETINSQFIESNFLLVNKQPEITQFYVCQQNQFIEENNFANSNEEQQVKNHQQTFERDEQIKSQVLQISQQEQQRIKEEVIFQDQSEQKENTIQLNGEMEQLIFNGQINKLEEFEQDQNQNVESTVCEKFQQDQQPDQQIQTNNQIKEFQNYSNKHEEIKEDQIHVIYTQELNERNDTNNSKDIPQTISDSVQQSPSIFLQKQNIPQVLALPISEFTLLKSCNSNFDPPPNFQDANKLLNSNELLLKSENQGFTVFKQNDVEVNSLLQSEELRRDFSFPTPVNLRHQQQSRKSSTQIQEIPEPESPQAESRGNSELRKSQTEEMFKQSLGTTFRVTFNSEFRASVSGFFQSQQFDLTIRQQDSLQYSMDESQEIKPIFITAVHLDDDEIDVYQINDKLRFIDKKGKYQHYDYKISTIAQSNCDYINNNLYIYAINNGIKCLEGCQVIKIQKFVMKYSFVQACYLICDHKPYLAILHKSYLRIKIEILQNNNPFKEIILNQCSSKLRQLIGQYFSELCPRLLTIESNYKEVVIAIIEQLEQN